MQRVLILSASSGAGHIRAASAIEKAFQAKGNFEVRHEDALKYTSVAFKTFYSRGYIKMVNTLPGVLGLLYDYADQPWKDEGRRLTIDRMNTLPLVRMINREKPDLIIATHFLPAEIISYLICKKRIDTSLSVVVTDMDVHAMWLQRHYSQYFVAMDETKEHLKMLGFDPKSVVVSGIPIDPIFSVKKDKLEMRHKYGLDQNIPTIYMSSGGFGVGKTEELLGNLANMKQEAQVLAMCGKNQRLKGRLENLAYSLPSDSKLKIIPVSYTTEVDEYMSASDIVLGKPGGLTTSEALAKELAFVIVNPIPGQEERNADHLLEQGAAIRCNNLPALAYKVDSLISNPERLECLKQNAAKLAKPDAAFKIVDRVSHDETKMLKNLDAGHHCSGRMKRILRRAEFDFSRNQELKAI